MSFLRPTPPSAGAAGPDPAPSAIDLLRALIEDIPRLIGERVQLLTLELQRARQAFVVIAALVITATLLLLTAWAVIWGAIVAALIQLGLAWGWAVLIVLVVNIGGAVAALLYASSLSRFLALPATKRHLTLATRNPGTAGDDTPFTNPGSGAAAAVAAPAVVPRRRPIPERPAP